MLTIRVAVALSIFSGALAGPACSRKHWGTSDCIQRCKTRWGWSGSVMGSDPWGSVMSSSSGSMESTVSEACGSDTVVSGAVSTGTSSAIEETTPTSILSSSSLSSSSSSSAASSTSILVESSSVASEPSSAPAAFIPVASSSSSTSEFTSFTPETSSSFFEPASTTSEPSQPPATTEVPDTTEQAPATSTEAPPPTTTSSSEAAPPASSSDSGSSSSSNSEATSQSDIDAYLKGHNDVRAQHGASDLTWSDDLAAAAQDWANRCVFKHSGGQLGPYGENLAAGTGDYSIASGIKAWTDEGYDGSTPNHFTQVVWKATTQVGCAVASCDGIFDATANFYVCEYSPAGNVIGAFDANVQA